MYIQKDIKHEWCWQECCINVNIWNKNNEKAANSTLSRTMYCKLMYKNSMVDKIADEYKPSTIGIIKKIKRGKTKHIDRKSVV